jgi:5-methylcytosine-specific restriction enzyme B
METKTVTLKNGEYTCDVGISVEEWKNILQDENLMKDNYKDVLAKFFNELNHKSTCKALGEKYNTSPQSFNGTITNFAKAVQKKINRFQVIDIDGSPTYWSIPMNGKRLRGGLFEWRMREELVKAVLELDFFNSNEKQLEEYKRFKKLLEYFVAHLEWVNNNDENGSGYEEYIKPLIEIKSFKKTGQGYNGENIQKQIEKYDKYNNGKICINIQSNFRDYKTATCYLNWEGTGFNIRAKWNGNKIEYLSQEEFQNKPRKRQDLNYTKSIHSLGLFDNKEEVTKTLIDFFEKFKRLIIKHNSNQQESKHMQSLKPYIDLLTANHNLILTGAPGTGKTFLVREIAKALNAEIGFVQFHPSYDYTDFVEGLRPSPPDENGNIGFVRRDGVFKDFCKKALNTKNDLSFDELYDEFINELSESNIEFQTPTLKKKFRVEINSNKTCVAVPNTEIGTRMSITKGMIKEYVYSGRVIDWKPYTTPIAEYFISKYDFKPEPINDERKFVFIIDEINRGEISKIFGELFFLLDSGYRGEENKVRTQYSNLIESGDVFFDGFYIPENVYIIGTMNDIDRSVESFDFAMRRRFAWKEIKAIDRISMWEGEIDDWKEEARKRMESINAIIEAIEGLGSAFHIGPAYFLRLRNYNGDFEQLWDNHLEVVLIEYLRGLPKREKRLEDLKLAYNNIEESLVDVENN